MVGVVVVVVVAVVVVVVVVVVLSSPSSLSWCFTTIKTIRLIRDGSAGRPPRLSHTS